MFDFKKYDRISKKKILFKKNIFGVVGKNYVLFYWKKKSPIKEGKNCGA